MNQRKYALDILSYVGVTSLKLAKFHLPKGMKPSIEAERYYLVPRAARD